MKKLILSMVFVFAFVAVTPTSANTIEKTTSVGCFEVCDFIASFSGMNFDITYLQEYEIFAGCMDNCSVQ